MLWNSSHRTRRRRPDAERAPVRVTSLGSLFITGQPLQRSFRPQCRRAAVADAHSSPSLRAATPEGRTTAKWSPRLRIGAPRPTTDPGWGWRRGSDGGPAALGRPGRGSVAADPATANAGLA